MEFRAAFRRADAGIGEDTFHVTDTLEAIVSRSSDELHINISSDNLILSDIYIPIKDANVLASAMRDYEENEDYEYAKLVGSFFAFGRWAYDKPMSAYSD